MRPASFLSIVFRIKAVFSAAALLTVCLLPSAAPANTDLWTDASGDNLWNSTSVNWLVNGSPGTFGLDDSAIFNDSAGAGHFSISVPGDILANTQ